MENNDTPPFHAHHTPDQARMAAALLFALDGIPMLYYGQPVGAPYQYPSYPSGDPLTRYDRDGLWAYYQYLIRLRKTFPAFTADGFDALDVGPATISGHVYAFRRPHPEGDVVAAVNLADDSVGVTLDLPVAELPVGAPLYLTDLFTGESLAVDADALDELAVALPGHTTRPPRCRRTPSRPS